MRSTTLFPWVTEILDFEDIVKLLFPYITSLGVSIICLNIAYTHIRTAILCFVHQNPKLTLVLCDAPPVSMDSISEEI